EQLRRRKHAVNVVARPKNRDRLIDDVVLVGLELIHPTLLNQLDHPARIEINREADAGTVLRQMLDREPETPRPARTEHQPVRSFWKLVLRQRLAEQLVVDP